MGPCFVYVHSLRVPSDLRIETCKVEKRSNMFFQHDIARTYLTV